MLRLIRTLTGLAGAVLCLAGCATAPLSSTAEAGHGGKGGLRPMPSAAAFQSTPLAVQTGKASWYSKGAHGRPTANGETYNHWDWTCAHRHFPLGSFVRVTRLDCGKSVILQVNDRGPYIRGRIVDVSRSAAMSLDMMTRGVVMVRVERLKLKPEHTLVYHESLPYRRNRPVPGLVTPASTASAPVVVASAAPRKVAPAWPPAAPPRFEPAMVTARR
jgi:rare lipoprotein A